MKHVYSAATTWIAMLIFAPASPAANVTTFSDPTSFLAAAGGPSLTLDFNGVPEPYIHGQVVDGASFDSRITFRSPEALDASKVVRFLDALSDAGSTTAAFNVGPLEGVFNLPARAFGLTFGSASRLQTIELFDVDGNTLVTVMPSTPNGFFGVQSETPIGRWVIRNGLFESGSRDRFSIDDFQAMHVPEPNSIRIVLWSIMALLLMVRARIGPSTERILPGLVHSTI